MNRVWAVDPFYSAADDVQDASDRLQERFRLWQSRRRGGQIEKKEGSEDGILDDECTERELIAACDSIEWQLDEFDKVIKVTSLAPDTFHVSEEELARRRQFVAALRFLVSGVRRTLANATAMAHESRVAAERDADRASPDSSAASPSWADGAVRPVRREGPSAGSGGAGEHDMARLGAFLGVEMRDGGGAPGEGKRRHGVAVAAAASKDPAEEKRLEALREMQNVQLEAMLLQPGGKGGKDLYLDMEMVDAHSAPHGIVGRAVQGTKKFFVRGLRTIASINRFQLAMVILLGMAAAGFKTYHHGAVETS